MLNGGKNMITEDDKAIFESIINLEQPSNYNLEKHLIKKAHPDAEIFIKDAHDSARNLILSELPDYVQLHRGWQGCPCSMMGGLDDSFDAVMFIGYHSPSRSDGNPLSHTMNTRIHHVKICCHNCTFFLLMNKIHCLIC